MIITCPACSTRYSLKPGLLGAAGKMVRCSNCAHSWFQEPVREGDSARRPSPRRTREPAFAASEPAFAAAPAFGPAFEPKPAFEPEPVVASMPEPMAEAAARVQPEPMPMPEPMPAPGPAAESESPSDEELDAMLGTETDSIRSLVGGEVEDAGDQPDSIEAIPEPEPIPGVFKINDVEEREPGKGSRLGLIVGSVAALAIVALVGTLVLARDRVVAMWPGAASLYAMVGLPVHILGAGLDIRGVRSERVEDGGDAVVVNGSIFNVSDGPRKVPMIRVMLFDAGHDMVQSVVVAPARGELAPGEVIRFQGRVEKPMATARSIEVTFTEADVTPAPSDKKPAEGDTKSIAPSGS